MPAAPLAWPLLMVAVAAWACVGGMLFFIGARLVSPDSNLLFIWVNAYTWWAYLPGYPVAVAALTLRRRWLLPASGVVVAFHLFWVLPDYRPAEDIPPEAREAPTLTLMTTNVFFDSAGFGPIADEIMEVNADIVFIQEYGPGIERELLARDAEARYPFRDVIWENQFFGLAIYSKLPLIDAQHVYAGGRPYTRTTVEVDGLQVVLFNVHPTSPGLGSGLSGSWNEAWRAITRVVAEHKGPVILAGDFNMNQHHRWYRQLKDDGLDNCHEERGRGNATTWPQLRKLRPIRVDHVFHSGDIVCLSVHEGRGEGSDHKPVIAELAILPD